jgi:peroxiredoxin
VTLGFVVLVRTQPGSGGLVGRVAPDVSGPTLDGGSLNLADFRGRPVIVNFWGPSCVPCRDEFPLMLSKLEQHADDGLAIIGVLTDDPPEPARTFVDEMGATWPTVLDEDQAIRRAFSVVARPYTFFIDADGVLRSIQIGEIQDAAFERQYALIAT